MWAPARDDWDPDATFVPGSDEEGGGRWVQHRPVPRQWELSRGDVRFAASLTPFRHLGFFPDMAPQWDWMRERSADADVLNLFGYTGVGTLLLSDAGARLVHVDASKKSVEQGKDNARAVGHGRSPDPLDRRRCDASSPRARFGAAGATTAYCSIRPSSAAGPTGEVWRLEENLAPLLADCRKLLDDEQPVPGADRLCRAHVRARDRRAGEADASATSAARSRWARWRCARRRAGLLLPTAIFARWSRTRS